MAGAGAPQETDVHAEGRGMVRSPEGQFVFERDRGISHLATRRQVSYVIVPFDRPDTESSSLFRALADARVNIYLIKMLPKCVGFAADLKDIDRAEETLRRGGWEPEIYRECALVSVVSPEMREIPGVMARLVKCLHKTGIEIRGFADSFNSVSCLIADAQTDEALKAIEKEFRVSLPDQANPLDPW